MSFAVLIDSRQWGRSGAMSDDRETCRQAAAECIELARAIRDPAKKEALILRAQEWLKLAYADTDDEFAALVSQFNAEQIQPQPMQQQQSRETSKG
jgi:hypothetical protein